ncbi:MAG: OsmC family protein [Candidatus Marinimicrobia bacterium]|nr:OsmC family protein [Candidatus Neomarinimicrobiota bacterium]
MKVSLHRASGITFLAKGDSNHWVVLDSKKQFGGSEAASQPMEMMLMALGGCTAMDIESLINKMRTPAEEFQIEIDAARSAEHPRVFTEIHMTFIFKGADLNKQNIKKAVRLSQEKYCSVSATLSRAIDISYDIVFNPAEE